MTRTNGVARMAVLAAFAAFPACKTDFGPLGQYLSCDDERRCVPGYRCARTDLGAVCLDDVQWAALCGAEESCNGRDDNCDGETDEGITNRCGTCGLEPTETCNGRDDDCNGATDDGLADVVSGTNEGECAVRVERCVAGGLSAIAEGVLPSDEACDGLDNDCDGVTDDGVPLRIIGTAVGECRLTVEACVEGEYLVTQPGIWPTDELCNDRDDNCDGETDEDFPELDDECVVGDGACAVIGVFECGPDGGVACSAVPESPSTELCDGEDNNCDGATDETFAELESACSVGVGACRANGARVCRDDGFGTRCNAETLAPTAERCDGEDNDCNGFIDDGLGDGCCIPGTTHACGVILGACTVGVQSCSQDRQWGACSGVAASDDVCDGLDNDCDGEADEGLAGCCGAVGGLVSCSVTRGACVAGQQRCGGDGMWSACSGVLPIAERCNGADDDCDGATDEDFTDLEEPCSVGVGACSASGVRVCTVDGLGTTCGATAGTSNLEMCNLLDDDCDGEVDDGLVVVTGTNVGECVEGIERCINGAWVVVQERADASAESCNLLDDDCDGIADDDAPSCCAPGAVRTCGINRGMCTVGSQTCGEDRAWSACTGVLPMSESCNLLDDDCDGVTDNPWHLSIGTACTVGLGTCARSGVYECNPDFSPSGGERTGVRCTAAPGSSGTEICNGFDDDCNGVADEIEDVPPVTEGSNVGRCRPRVLACIRGEMSEVEPAVGPSVEVCNGSDDDCSGMTDNDIASVSCYTGPAGTAGIGVCREGWTSCVSGAVRCTDQVLPSAERCNAADDDCDGATDGSVDALSGASVPLQQPCYTGPAGTADIGICRAGTTMCTRGMWGGCQGEVLPVTEACGDAADGDCDGRNDGITFLEDFEDDCSVPEATVTTDVPFDCVETPADAVDPSRTPEGDQSLRLQLAYVDRNIETIIEWQFSACIPDANGSATLYATTVPQGSAGLFFHPVFEGRGVQFRYTTDGAIAVAVDSEDGGSDVYVQPFTLGTNQWRTISWSFVAAGGTIAYALDGATFFEEQITGTVDGVFLRSQVSGANAEIDMLVDDVRFSSP